MGDQDRLVRLGAVVPGKNHDFHPISAEKALRYADQEFFGLAILTPQFFFSICSDWAHSIYQVTANDAESGFLDSRRQGIELAEISIQ